MRPFIVAVGTLALGLVFGACTSTRAPEVDGVTQEPEPALGSPPLTPTSGRTYSETVGDAEGAGLDLGDTSVAVDDEGVLHIDVTIPEAERSEHSASDNVQVYLDVDLDYEHNGYDVRFVLFGGASRPFAMHRWERERWRDRTPASYEASFDHGIHVRVPAADVGIRPSGVFDLFVASIDESTGLVSDLAPDGALSERWTYTR